MEDEPIGAGSFWERCQEMTIEEPVAQERHGGRDEVGEDIDRFIVKVE